MHRRGIEPDLVTCNIGEGFSLIFLLRSPALLGSLARTLACPLPSSQPPSLTRSLSRSRSLARALSLPSHTEIHMHALFHPTRHRFNLTEIPVYNCTTCACAVLKACAASRREGNAEAAHAAAKLAEAMASELF